MMLGKIKNIHKVNIPNGWVFYRLGWELEMG